MSADTLKSPSITNSDASPVIANSTGEGGPGYMKTINDSVTPTAAGLVDTGSVYRMVRLPSNAKLKALTFSSEADLDTSTGLAFDVGAYYSDSPTDGTPLSSTGAVIDADAFSAAFVYAVGDTNVLNTMSLANRNKPLWSALALTSDPGGFIDVVLAVHTAAGAAVSHAVGIRADYVE